MAKMVDVSDRPATERRAWATVRVRMRADTLLAIRAGRIAKGDVVTVARIAGITGAKQCSQLLPLCHPLPLDGVQVDIEDDGDDGLRILASCRTRAATGVEMEALTACAATALCVYDMCKTQDPEMTIDGLCLLRKEGGRSGLWQRQEQEG